MADKFDCAKSTAAKNKIAPGNPVFSRTFYDCPRVTIDRERGRLA